MVLRSQRLQILSREQESLERVSEVSRKDVKEESQKPNGPLEMKILRLQNKKIKK